MEQSELRLFFRWCESTLRTFYTETYDESECYYIGDIRIGGWAGDRQEYFFEHTNEFAKTLRMYEASQNQAVEVQL